MKQLLQSLKDGSTRLADVPTPCADAGQLLIRTTTTLVSAGTERMMVAFGKANWLDKARQQPDKVRMVLEKVRTDGLATTMDAVRSKLDQPLAPGYCNVGVVAEIGAGIEGLAIGDRVASNGKHAQMVCVPRNLCARIPDNVTDAQAAFTVVAAIGLQGVRLVDPDLGECIVVTGLGLIGLLVVQLLRAQGCRVLGVDPDPARRALAQRFGAEVVASQTGVDVLAAAQLFSRGRGVDAVIITASTSSNEPVHQAAQMCRKRGRIVLVGVVGLALSRADFYEKELVFQVSCSYGPGRHDPAYEEAGHDYPVGFVRWTEQRNFEAVLDLLASGALDVEPLISHRFDFEDAGDAYDLLAGKTPSLGIILNYPAPEDDEASTPVQRQVVVATVDSSSTNTAPKVAFIGAGNHAGRVLIPAFKRAGANLHAVVSGTGVSASHYASRHGFTVASSDSAATLADPGVDAVVIATRHNLHAPMVLAALNAGKHVFCEKPLCLTSDELAAIESAAPSSAVLMVGFNRRFAPHTVKIKSLLTNVAVPKSMIMTVNAGAIPADHWTQDPAIGGGRLVGEACHFIDLLRHLAAAAIIHVEVTMLGGSRAVGPRDSAVISLTFADGSIGTIHYLANGNKAFPKERLEIFCAGRILQLDNFRKLRGWGWKGFTSMNLWRQDKGQTACAAAFINAIHNGAPAPIPRDEIFEVSRVAMAAQALAM